MKSSLEDGLLIFFCPACGHNHSIPVNNFNMLYNLQWNWNGDQFKPSLHPSVRHRNEHGETVCHYHIEEGRIRYVNDYRHPFAGTIHELPDIKY